MCILTDHLCHTHTPTPTPTPTCTHTHTHTPYSLHLFTQELSKQAEKEKQACEAHHLNLYRQHKAEQAEMNYRKHYQLASSIMDQILDLTSKIAEYRELTEK